MRVRIRACMLPMKTLKSLIWKGKEPTAEMRKEIESLPALTVNELREKFGEVLGYATASRNRHFLMRKITWGVQARQWGDISPEARQRAHELADLRFLRIRMPKDIEMGVPEMDGTCVVRKKVKLSRDPRIPMPGCLLTKDWGERRIEVRILDDGFEFEGRRYRSLSAIAKEVTGTNWNGFMFFGLGGGK
jgi:hypothetical protein